MQAVFFLDALQSYSFVKHIHWIDFNNFNIVEVCTVQLYYQGKYIRKYGTRYQQKLNKVGSGSGAKKLDLDIPRTAVKSWFGICLQTGI